MSGELPPPGSLSLATLPRKRERDYERRTISASSASTPSAVTVNGLISISDTLGRDRRMLRQPGQAADRVLERRAVRRRLAARAVEDAHGRLLGDERVDVMLARGRQPERDLPQDVDIDAPEAEHDAGAEVRVDAQRKNPFGLRRPPGLDQKPLQSAVRHALRDGPAGGFRRCGRVRAGRSRRPRRTCA